MRLDEDDAVEKAEMFLPELFEKGIKDVFSVISEYLVNSAFMYTP